MGEEQTDGANRKRLHEIQGKEEEEEAKMGKSLKGLTEYMEYRGLEP